MRSVTIFVSTEKTITSRAIRNENKELVRFYRHTDGHPSGHGLDIANAIENMNESGCGVNDWATQLTTRLCDGGAFIETEGVGDEHSHISYIYVVRCTTEAGKKDYENGLPISIAVYGDGRESDYTTAFINGPVFKGSAREYIEKYGM